MFPSWEAGAFLHGNSKWQNEVNVLEFHFFSSFVYVWRFFLYASDMGKLMKVHVHGRRDVCISLTKIY